MARPPIKLLMLRRGLIIHEVSVTVCPSGKYLRLLGHPAFVGVRLIIYFVKVENVQGEKRV